MKRVVIIGGGPAGMACATYAARYGASVTMVEKDIVGGAAHLWDCIPSKAMIATGGAFNFLKIAEKMGLEGVEPEVHPDALRERIKAIEERLNTSSRELLESQGVRIMNGRGAMVGPNQVMVEEGDKSEVIEADYVLLATGTRPRIPDWVNVDHERILTTRDAYPPKEFPRHLVVIGSGVTGVEFVHMFKSFGSEVTLIVSRQQVLPEKDPEVAAALEEDFIRRDVKLMKGAKAESIEVDGDVVKVKTTDGRVAEGSHALLAIGSIPNSDRMGLEEIGVEMKHGYIAVDSALRSSVPHIYAAGDLSGKLPLSSVASMQGRKIAEHIMGFSTETRREMDYDKAASAIFTEPEIADVGLAEADAFASGRKIRVTKVPFSVSAKALINEQTRGFVKIVSDPATGVILGGSIVGRHAAELISVIALAVNAGLTVNDLVESLFVHPTLAEVLSEAAE